jgi:hypothetical protein
MSSAASVNISVRTTSLPPRGSARSWWYASGAVQICYRRRVRSRCRATARRLLTVDRVTELRFDVDEETEVRARELLEAEHDRPTGDSESPLAA